jgi:2-desacetyl-2-hydroxyethyl bacteriochlorophyllide A dehydrogenase
MGLERRSLYFTAPCKTEIRAEQMPAPAPGEVLVEALISAISPGTEMLIYRGQFPADLAVDESISALAGEFGYPLKYGYSNIGRVTALGAGVEQHWLGRRVFMFQPHETHFTTSVGSLLPVPDGLADTDAVFLPNIETAVNFLLDGQPLIGEHVLVFGQGVVGLLTTSLLAQMPLASLITVDSYPQRRDVSLAAGAHASLDPLDQHFGEQLRDLLPDGCDLCFELSGNPKALDQAIAATGFNGRIIIGSWYGQKRADLNLGGTFHRSRIRLISSQVSTLTPELRGRWTKDRRMAVAWKVLEVVQPSRFITHRFDFEAAEQAYNLIDQHPDQTIQVMLTYGVGT